jgi:hypothetical protein
LRKSHQGFRSSSPRSGQRTSSPASSSRTAAIRRSRRRLRSSPPSNARSAARTLGSARVRRALAALRSIHPCWSVTGFSAVYGQRRRWDAPCAPLLFLPMIRHLPDSPDPAPKETGPADRPVVCRSAGSSGSPSPRLGSSASTDRHRPWIRQGGMPAAWRIGRRPTVWCRPHPGTAAAAGSDPPAGSRPGRARRSLVDSGEHSGLMGPEPPTPSSPGRSDQDRTVPATPADRRSPC